METITFWLSENLKKNGHGPFLFLGSGFSRRYIELDDWEKLLRIFCKNIRQFEYYLSKSNSNLPKTASLMSEDYSEFWWSDENLEKERNQFLSHAKYKDSPLKISISEYIRIKSLSNESELINANNEIKELVRTNVDGVITTNWDILAENLFPDYKVYIGQEELLVSTPQNIGEIYKIHGCCTKPNSLILTESDYEKFNKNNPYLASKLITIFVENPVIFIGYSLNDPNIKGILSSIVNGIGKENIKKITNNLIFVQRENEFRKYGIYETVYSLGDTDIPVKLLVTSDYSEIYKSLQTVQRKIPARILRYCKEQIYKLVKSTDPSAKLCVVDFENIDDSTNIEFVMGVGVTDGLGEKGYKGLRLEDIFYDIIFDNGNFDSLKLLESINSFSVATKYIPVYKYLRLLGVCAGDQYKEQGFNLRPVDDFDRRDFTNTQYSKLFKRECANMSLGKIIEIYPDNKAIFLIPFMSWKKIDLESLKQFLERNIENVYQKNCTYSTYYRKLICIYDILKYGWILQKDS